MCDFSNACEQQKWQTWKRNISTREIHLNQEIEMQISWNISKESSYYEKDFL